MARPYLAALMATVAVMLTVAACGGDDGPGAAATPSAAATAPLPTPPPQGEAPFSIRGPLDAAEALAQEAIQPGSRYVLDLATGEVYVVEPDAEQEQGAAVIGWLDDRFWVRAGADYYLARFDGTIEPSGRPAGTPTPDPSAPASSADGLWVASHEEGAYSGLLVGPGGADPTMRLTSVAGSRWSPSGHQLAFLGSVCAGFDLFVFDPETRELTNLSESLPVIFDLLWRPDGGAIAVNLIGAGDRRVLSLIDVATGRDETLAEIHFGGDLYPVAWNPRGDRLAFGYNRGRGACEDIGMPGVPTPAAATLELLGP